MQEINLAVDLMQQKLNDLKVFIEKNPNALHEIPNENEIPIQEQDQEQLNHEEYLGAGYENKIRTMLTVDEKLLPNRIINADANIGAMKLMVSPIIMKMQKDGKEVDTAEKYQKLSDAALYYLSSVLCVALRSRTSVPPFNIPPYQKKWDKKRNSYVQRGNGRLAELMSMG